MVVVVGGGQELEDHFSAETFRTKHLDFLSARGEGQRVEPEMGLEPVSGTVETSGQNTPFLQPWGFAGRCLSMAP